MAEDEAQDAVETGDEDEGGSCACEWCEELDADDLSLISLCAGVGALFLGMFGFPRWPHLLALPLGLTALYSGYLSFKKDTAREKQASAGLVCGTIGICFWVICSAYAELRILLGW